MIGFYILGVLIAVFTGLGIFELWESRDFDEYGEPVPRPPRRRAGFKP